MHRWYEMKNRSSFARKEKSRFRLQNSTQIVCFSFANWTTHPSFVLQIFRSFFFSGYQILDVHAVFAIAFVQKMRSRYYDDCVKLLCLRFQNTSSHEFIIYTLQVIAKWKYQCGQKQKWFNFRTNKIRNCKAEESWHLCLIGWRLDTRVSIV